MRKILNTPMRRASGVGIAAVCVLSLAFWRPLVQLAERPSAQLLRTMAEIGATLLIVYAVEFSSALRSSRLREKAQEVWVGAIVGGAAAGMVGIVVALSLAERAEVGHWNSIDALAFSFAFSSLVFLAVFVVVFPQFAFEWARGSDRPDRDGG
jgi:hypothetical protein